MNGDARREDEWAIPALTKRQREVLDLLVRGCSNPQIAEALGISLDGAKWHVSEVMAKLGAGSRQGAAERWRRHQRLGARVRRGLRALVPTALWAKVVVGGICLAVVGGAAATVVAVDMQSAPVNMTLEPPVGDTPTASDPVWLQRIGEAHAILDLTVQHPIPTTTTVLDVCAPMPTDVHFSQSFSEPAGVPGWGLSIIEFTDVSNGGDGPSYAVIVDWHQPLDDCDPRLRRIVTGMKNDAARADVQLCVTMRAIAARTLVPEPSDGLPSPPVAHTYFTTFCESQADGTATTTSPAALATHPANYLPPGNACATVGYPALQISFDGDDVLGVLDTRADSPLAGRWNIVFPGGFHRGERDGERVVLSEDGAVVIHDGDAIPNPAICEFDGKFYVDDPISVPTLPPGR